MGILIFLVVVAVSFVLGIATTFIIIVKKVSNHLFTRDEIRAKLI